MNAIAPGWIDTDYTVYEGPDALQQPAGRVGNPMDIANMVLYLCSDKAGFIIGENICIDGRMTRHMIYHNDFADPARRESYMKTVICYYSPAPWEYPEGAGGHGGGGRSGPRGCDHPPERPAGGI